MFDIMNEIDNCPVSNLLNLLIWSVCFSNSFHMNWKRHFDKFNHGIALLYMLIHIAFKKSIYKWLLGISADKRGGSMAILP